MEGMGRARYGVEEEGIEHGSQKEEGFHKQREREKKDSQNAKMRDPS